MKTLKFIRLLMPILSKIGFAVESRKMENLLAREFRFYHHRYGYSYTWVIREIDLL